MTTQQHVLHPRMSIAVMAMLLLLLLISGCGYGTVSTQAYELAKAAYNISDRQLSDKLPELEKLIDSSLAESKISSREAAWLHEIREHAAAGDWTTAAAKARRIMQDQAR